MNYLHTAAVTLLANALPGQWSIDPLYKEDCNCRAWYLKRTDGLTLFYNISGSKDQSRASYSQPRHPRYGMFTLYTEGGRKIEQPAIGFSPDKDVNAVAKDIVRRLLPDAETAHAAAARFMQSTDAAYAAQAASIDAVCTAGGVPNPGTGHNGEPRTGTHLNQNTGTYSSRGHADFKVNTGGTVDFDIRSLPREKAVLVAAMLKSIFES